MNKNLPKSVTGQFWYYLALAIFVKIMLDVFS
jgi:hypothetical protein